MPPENLPKAQLELCNRAMARIKNNQLDNSIDLWKQFLQNNPRSFRGHNNLGMAFYSNDQLALAVTSFETALALEPFDTKIKDNLKRALPFQATIFRENKDFETAIEHLKRVKKITETLSTSGSIRWKIMKRLWRNIPTTRKTLMRPSV